MSLEQEIIICKKSESRPLELLSGFENDFVDDKGLFSRAHLGTVLRPGVVRPLSPTLKVHSPESVFPGIAMLCNGFENMQEWKNRIKFVGFFARKRNMFNRRHHWKMRANFVEVRLRCMEKIVEDPPPNTSHGEFFEGISRKEKKSKTALVLKGESCQENDTSFNENICNELIFDDQDILSSKHSMIFEQQQVQKEDISVQLDDAEEGKLVRESLQKAYEIKTQPKTLCFYGDRKHYSLANDDMQDLVVVGKSVQPKFTTVVVNGTQETENLEGGFSSELVVEDINDVDFHQETTLSSSCKLAHNGHQNSQNVGQAGISTRKACRKLFKRAAVDGAKQQKTSSRLQRLRRILFSCFQRNQVTPVDM